MAKSLRSKTKRSFRRVKREDSAFSVAHAARLERLSARLTNIKEQAPPEREPEEEQDDAAEMLDASESATKMEVEVNNGTKSKTSGARGTRRGVRKMHKAQEKNRSKQHRRRR